ncbi:MAG: hypothetical protein PHX39_10675, partial [Bacteroidales bacterium]|nr:hypothetical protein [Bacteroidales bacterium]
MRDFFKFMFASMLGFLIMSVIMFFVFLGLISGLAAMMQTQETQVAENTLLHIKFDAPLIDRTSKDPFSNFSF